MFTTDNELGYADPIIAGLSGSGVDVWTFVTLSDAQQNRILSRLTAAQRVALYRELLAAQGVSGLGEDAELGSWFSKAIKKVGGLIAPLVSMIPVIGPVAAQVVSSLATPTPQAQQVAPPPPPPQQQQQQQQSSTPSWLLPLAIGGGILLLARRR